jgi:two-component system, OmpR family, phosphate regulon sensor histidine kinase PhoR
MHKALERQLQKFLSDVDPTSPQWVKFINAVNDTYIGFDEDHKLMSRSLDLSSKEFVEINEKLQHNRNQILREKAKDDAILESIGDSLVITDNAGKIVLVNKAAEQMFLCPKKDLIGKDFYSAINLADDKSVPITKDDSPLTQALASKTKASLSCSLINREGIYFVGVIATPYIFDEEIVGAVVAFRDITKEKEIDQAKTEFVSLASHQLRTPLSTIGWYTETLLSGEMGTLTDEQREYLTEVYEANKRMTHLVKALLNVSRVDIGTLLAEPEDLDIFALAEISWKDVEEKIKSKELVIERHYDKNLPKIYADPKLVQIIFQNLLTNSVKYTPPKGKVELTIGFDPDIKENYQIIVADTGYGIPKYQESKIFQKLFRADNVREKETDGTGLGLYLVKSIVEKVGGKIRFESELNKGTKFFVSMPMKTEKILGTKKLG